MVIVFGPFGRIVGDVLPGRGQFAVVADHPFVIIALPDRCAGVVADLVDAFGDGGFE